MATGAVVLIACGGGGQAGRAPVADPPAQPKQAQRAAEARPVRAAPARPDPNEIREAAERIVAERNELARRVDDRLNELAPSVARGLAVKVFKGSLKGAFFVGEEVSTKRIRDLQVDGKTIERWEAAGTVDTISEDAAWDMHLVCVGNKFLPVAVWVNSKLVFEDVSYPGIEREANDQAREAERREKVAARQETLSAFKQAADSRPDEEKAGSILRTAKPLIDAGKKVAAQKRLEELVNSFPETLAADEARELLDKLK